MVPGKREEKEGKKPTQQQNIPKRQKKVGKKEKETEKPTKHRIHRSGPENRQFVSVSDYSTDWLLDDILHHSFKTAGPSVIPEAVPSDPPSSRGRCFCQEVMNRRRQRSLTQVCVSPPSDGSSSSSR